MSWGRWPYYIWSDGKIVNFWGPDVRAEVPEDAIAQLIASMANRGGDELTEFIERGKGLRPEISHNLAVTVTGAGWDKRDSNDD